MVQRLGFICGVQSFLLAQCLMVGVEATPAQDRGESRDTLMCGGVHIVLDGTQFKDTFSILYEVRFDPTYEPFCLPAAIYEYGEVPDGAIVELRMEGDPWKDVEDLSQPMFFPEKTFKLVPGPHGHPSTQRVSRYDGDGKYTTPAGRYRLVVRYRPAPCDTIQGVEQACVAASPVFTLMSDTIEVH